ncbi:helix-turn-helix protein [Palleronia aestuarii]|uniref:Helix-turn-helix protein n=1 Tax=Palleronia aestuarii TaxID=568105 RepID=A0A2W7N0A0_9RHOB|nr:helix-turn-helix domain-containing protein [Palleronia aestuarii]PZX11857.1 helix-turn-helix protein [Palleronia aestuarii]
MMSFAAQLRMARAGLGWSQARVAETAGIPLPMYQAIEEGRDAGAVPALVPIRATLEAAGVEFIEGNVADQG